jgi:hypothetical protein
MRGDFPGRIPRKKPNTLQLIALTPGKVYPVIKEGNSEAFP